MRRITQALKRDEMGRAELRMAGSFTLLALAISFGGCGDARPSQPAGAKRGGPVAFPVEVDRVRSREVDYGLSAVGSVEAFDTLQVTARVAGAVERVLFREGDTVKKDQVLVEIEPERYRLAVDQGRANVEKAEALTAEAEGALARREAASEKQPGLIRGEEIDTFQVKARTARAELLAAKTSLAQAELNLRDAVVRAPIVGTMETRTVHEGQYVQPGTLLASMIRRDPLLLRFKVPSRDAAYLKPGMEVSFTTRRDHTKHRSVITLVAATAEETSRMVAITSEVRAPAHGENGRALGRDASHAGAPEVGRLTPGTFAEISVSLGAREAPVIPQRAVRPSERGFLVFAVEGAVARERVLVLGMRTSEGDVEVKSGLEAGELIVTRGSEALRDGVAVHIWDPRGPVDAGETSKGDGAGSATR